MARRRGEGSSGGATVEMLNPTLYEVEAWRAVMAEIIYL